MPEASRTDGPLLTGTAARGSALELAARIRSGEISAQEVMQAHIRRVENTRPNAVVVPLKEAARGRASRRRSAGAR